jgi:hypothetical protein
MFAGIQDISDFGNLQILDVQITDSHPAIIA